MRILLINPPYVTLTSRLGVGHQTPIGLLMVGGPLIDAGHEVKLLDAERRHLSTREILRAVKVFSPDVVMTGHSGSTPAHPVCVRMFKAIKADFPNVTTVYGGVYPTFHAEEILFRENSIDIIVRGEGEAGALDLVDKLDSHGPPAEVLGIAYRNKGHPVLTPDRPPIKNMDDFRIGWELIENWDHYQCFGLGRAAILQFSRGCPHPCTFCGQRDFWVEWRHRDPVKLVDEIEWLYRTHNICFLSLGDENPSTNKVIWKQFLEEMAARQLPVYFFTSIRASDIVRDADILHLYKKAGILYVLIGIESTEPEVLELIKKGSSTKLDLQALRLFRKHGIFSIVAHVVGWKEESWKTFITAIKQLIYYDGDFVNVTHVTPHSWTEFARESKDRPMIENDLSKWDYRHQILEQRNLSPWQVFLAVKLLETIVHARPRKLISLLRTKDEFLRKQLFWSFFHTTMLWLGETLVWAWEKLLPKKRPIYEVKPTSKSYILKSLSDQELPSIK